MSVNINNDISYQLSLNILKALGGDTTKPFQSVEEIWDDINGIYDNAGDRLDIEALILDIKNNGLYEYYPSENADAYAPVRLNVNIPQKYTEEYIQELEKSVFQEGYNEGNEEGYKNGYTAGNTDGYTDGYAEGLDDGTEQQKALLEETTFNDNGVYEREDGYKKVTVNVTPSEDVIDFTQIGWSAVDNKRIVDRFKADFEYTKSVTHKIDGKTSLSYVFRDDKDLVYAPMGDTSNVTNMTSMFEYCSSLKEVPLYDTSNVTNMTNMFNSCSSLTEIPLFDTSNVTNMGYTFSSCSSLTEIPLLDTSNVWDMSGMFVACSSLTEIPLLDTSKVTSMNGVFSSCSSLTEIPLLDTSKVTSMDYTFRDCSSLTEIPLLDTSKVTSMDYMFYNCKNLTTIPELDCSSLTGAYIFGYSTLTTLVNLGGFKNLGMQSSMSSNLNSYFLQSSKNVTYESLMNIINKLYDRKSAGYSVITLKFGADNLAKLTDEEKAMATNKGWTLS